MSFANTEPKEPPSEDFAPNVEGAGEFIRASRFTTARRKLHASLAAEHLFKTYRSLVYKDRSNKNPRFIERFQFDFEGFRRWSLENGFGLHKELVLENPRVIPNTCIRKKLLRHRVFRPDGTSYIFYEQVGGFYEAADEVFDDVSEDEWVTDYDLRWVPTSELCRMRPCPKLTPYGRARVTMRKAERRKRAEAMKKSRRRGMKHARITAFGEWKTASAWSRDPRAMVSDKVIKRRIACGVPPEEAITAPPDQAGRPRKG